MIESKIDELIAALDRTTAALSQEQPKTKARAPKAPAATESVQPAAAPAASTTAAPAPAPAAAQPPAPSPAAPTSSPSDGAPTLLLRMTNAIIKLANDYDHDTAIAILGKRKVKRCAEVPVAEYQAVLDEAEEAIAKAQAAAATSSLV